MGRLLIGQQHNSRGTQEKNFSNLFLLIFKKKGEKGKKNKEKRKRKKEEEKKRREKQKQVMRTFWQKYRLRTIKQTEESYMRSETS